MLITQPVTRTERLTELGRELLDLISPGWDADPHTADTPARWAKWWEEFIDHDAGNDSTTFPVANVARLDQMVAVTGIDVWSLCAHHLLPFSATVSVGYITADRLLGLSKFARIAHSAAHALTSQEEMATVIADRVQEVTGSSSVAVTASGLHLCMAMRGVRTPATMTTSITRGAFRDQPEARAEWFSILARSPHAHPAAP